MPDAGSRAVAVGFPSGVSAAFDAHTCRLAYAWSGPFLDASPVWDGRGGNPAHVLGPHIWNAPAGCPVGATTSNEPPDFAARAKDPAFGAGLPEGKLFDGRRGCCTSTAIPRTRTACRRSATICRRARTTGWT